jgi:Icc protein
MAMVRILHVSDTHLRAPGGKGTTAEPPPVDPAERLASVAAAARAAGMAFDAVVHTGDITDDCSEEAAAAVLDTLGGLAAHVVAVPGNHDDPAVVAAVFGAPALDLGRWRLVGIDTTVPEQVHGRVPQSDALHAALGDPTPADGRHTALVMHHPYASRSTHPWFSLEDSERLRSVLASRPDVRLLLTGHTHERYDASEPWGLALRGGAATYYGLRHDGDQMTYAPGTAGAQIHELHDDGTVATTAL